MRALTLNYIFPWKKRCPYCRKTDTKKYGRRREKQEYFCHTCARKFQKKGWAQKGVRPLWKGYGCEKQTQKQLGEKLGRSRAWVNRTLQERPLAFYKNTTVLPQPTVLIVDTTYFHQFGLMVFRSAHLKKNLLWYEVEHETNALYQHGIQELIDDGWDIQGIVADGKPGLHELFPLIPFQMCQFHQCQIVTRYISKKPQLEAGQELRSLMFLLTTTDEASFTGLLVEWYQKWRFFLSERTVDPGTGKRAFTHRRLRSAYFSLLRNLPDLFTHERHAPYFFIPNTTNSLDGYFSHLKAKVAIHRGASKTTQLKLIAELIFI